MSTESEGRKGKVRTKDPSSTCTQCAQCPPAVIIILRTTLLPLMIHNSTYNELCSAGCNARTFHPTLFISTVFHRSATRNVYTCFERIKSCKQGAVATSKKFALLPRPAHSSHWLASSKEGICRVFGPSFPLHLLPHQSNACTATCYLGHSAAESDELVLILPQALLVGWWNWGLGSA